MNEQDTTFSRSERNNITRIYLDFLMQRNEPTFSYYSKLAFRSHVDSPLCFHQ